MSLSLFQAHFFSDSLQQQIWVGRAANPGSFPNFLKHTCSLDYPPHKAHEIQWLCLIIPFLSYPNSFSKTSHSLLPASQPVLAKSVPSLYPTSHCLVLLNTSNFHCPAATSLSWAFLPSLCTSSYYSSSKLSSTKCNELSWVGLSWSRKRTLMEELEKSQYINVLMWC